MTDIYNEVFTALRNELKSEYPDIVVMSASQDTTAKFPCVTLKQIGDSTDVQNIDSNGEFTSTISFEVNSFTTGQKQETQNREIQKVINRVMSDSLGMLRISSEQVENYLDATVYRHILRYTCNVTKNKLIYRR